MCASALCGEGVEDVIDFDDCWVWEIFGYDGLEVWGGLHDLWGTETLQDGIGKREQGKCKYQHFDKRICQTGCFLSERRASSIYVEARKNEARSG